MFVTHVIILALLQGLTEFLPVSSSGHLVVARLLLGISDTGGMVFDAFLHLGTLGAVLAYYWKTWWGMARSVVRNDTEERDKRELLAKLAIATVPAAVAGYLFQNGVSEYFRSPLLLAVTFLITATALVISDYVSRTRLTLARARFSDAAAIGLAQIIALLPGISRSGITIAAGRARGLTRTQAAKFSFLLSAPIIAGAGLNSLAALIHAREFAAVELLLGFVVAFASGFAAIWLVMKYIERISFTPFAIYLCFVAAYLFYVG